MLFSKDGSQAFVMHPARVIPVTQMKFRFAYIEWDGSDYVDRTVVVSDVIPTPTVLALSHRLSEKCRRLIGITYGRE